MEQKDFILREIEKIGTLVRYMLGKYLRAKSNKQRAEAKEFVHKEFADQLGVDIETIAELPKTEFDTFFNINKGFDFENIELIADLLYAIGKEDIHIQIKYLSKALEIYAFINKKSKIFSYDRHEKIEQIETLL